MITRSDGEEKSRGVGRRKVPFFLNFRFSHTVHSLLAFVTHTSKLLNFDYHSIFVHNKLCARDVEIMFVRGSRVKRQHVSGATRAKIWKSMPKHYVFVFKTNK